LSLATLHAQNTKILTRVNRQLSDAHERGDSSADDWQGQCLRKRVCLLPNTFSVYSDLFVVIQSLFLINRRKQAGTTVTRAIPTYFTNIRLTLGALTQSL
jgi:hypothetical protein